MQKKLGLMRDLSKPKKPTYFNFRSKSKKSETIKINANPLRNSSKMNTRYDSSKNIKIEAIDSNQNSNAKSTNVNPKNLTQSQHMIINSTSIDYNKLLEEDRKQLELIKDKIALKKQKLEEKKKTLNEIKENNDKFKQKLYDKKKALDKIKEEKIKYENLNNELMNKINEVTQTIEAHRGQMRRREMMMNYLMTMLLGLRRHNEEEYPNVDNMTYEELLALEERMGSVNKGLSKEIIDKIPVEKFSRYKFSDDKCIICQYEFKVNEMLKVLPCKHCFHPDCIEEWLKNQKLCPFCKGEIKI